MNAQRQLGWGEGPNLLGVAYALLLTGCFNPDDIFPVKGRLESIDAVTAQPVRLTREAQVNFGPCTGNGQPFKETTASEQGDYGFELFRAQTQSLSGFGAYCFRAETTFPSGSEAWSDLQGIFDETRVATLRDWRPEASVGDGGVLRFTPPIPLPDDRAVLDGSVVTALDHRVEWRTSDGGLAWRADDHLQAFTRDPEAAAVPVRVDLVLDDETLEDFAGELTLRAHLGEYGEETFGPRGGRQYFESQLVAGQRLSLVGAKVPLTRGLACPDVATPCPLTDGDLTVKDVELREGFTLTLPSATEVSKLVLRGVETSLPAVSVLLGTEDGGVITLAPQVLPTSAWMEAPPVRLLEDGGFDQTFGASYFAVVPLDAGVPVKKVTLRFPGGLLRAAEVSLF